MLRLSQRCRDCLNGVETVSTGLRLFYEWKLELQGGIRLLVIWKFLICAKLAAKFLGRQREGGSEEFEGMWEAEILGECGRDEFP